ncbi:hypothetical protein PV325_009819, partial [Microctonus aethiopoides]
METEQSLLCEWKFLDYEPTNVLIYEKDYRDYIVIYVVDGTPILPKLSRTPLP